MAAEVLVLMRDPGRPLWAADQRTLIRSINRYQCNCWVQRSTCLISLVTSNPYSGSLGASLVVVPRVVVMRVVVPELLVLITNAVILILLYFGTFQVR